jgi:hypothetical protein
MFGVDKGDQQRAHMGGFARKSHYKKWYKKSLFAIFDCMLLNSHIAWNLSVKEVRNRKQMKRHDFYAWIWDDFLNKTDKDFDHVAAPPFSTPTSGTADETNIHTNLCDVRRHEDKKNLECVVCRSSYRLASKTSHADSKSKGLKRETRKCLTCNLVVHDTIPPVGRLIHSLFPQSTSCHDIVRSEVGRELWRVHEDGRRLMNRQHELVKRMKKEYEMSDSN